MIRRDKSRDVKEKQAPTLRRSTNYNQTAPSIISKSAAGHFTKPAYACECITFVKTQKKWERTFSNSLRSFAKTFQEPLAKKKALFSWVSSFKAIGSRNEAEHFERQKSLNETFKVVDETVKITKSVFSMVDWTFSGTSVAEADKSLWRNSSEFVIEVNKKWSKWWRKSFLQFYCK
jgi:hypothetical protein